MKTRIHAIAGFVAFIMIALFWTSTVLVEILGTYEAVATVKSLILLGMIVLIPAMAIVGATGMSLGAGRRDRLTKAKKTRMPLIAGNGILILVPAAFFLAARANAGVFDTWFYAVQALELVAGTANITMMGLNIRDGLMMTRRIRRAA
ncbi:hypothetical protein [Hoeflea prorocentri]|uniref:Uncharacterized protein n=1 Tax=Hoeflea prorocentri TaxID=1922333 RepID=A0A9X3ZIX4_9HYPH|nr:hypothetical protein [Hoeflea prorocentri]MCY6383367.1 hypothetical protein [Hoeflea prorocentri]MDA5401167.1 hypothetical protein [Hoeflea prorocentri]